MKQPISLARTILRNRRSRHVAPRFLTYLVTYRCNARCIMCDSWKKPTSSELTLNEVRRIVSQLPKMDGVRLTGGEPFLRPDLFEITHLIQTNLKPRFLHITSNGLLTDRIVRFCENRHKNIPLHLLFSIDGFETKHNEVRGVQEAWDKVTSTLAALYRRKKGLNLNISVNQTIVDSDGLEHYTLLKEYCDTFRIKVFAVLAYETSATYSLENETQVNPKEFGRFSTFGRFTSDQIDHLCSTVESDLKHHPFFSRLGKRYYWRGVRNRLLLDQTAPNPRCVALGSHLRLMPDGRVPTCQFNTHSVGNLKDQSFTEVWEGEAAARMREWVRNCPGCWAECEVIPNAVYSGDILVRGRA